jgi:four helix bundle protein
MRGMIEQGEKSGKGEKGMKGKAARTFEELHIYQRARELTNEIYRRSRGAAFSRDPGLVDQVRRAALSVLSNIAEGFERGTTTEFIHFLYIAKGSCGEVRAQLQIAHDQEYIPRDECHRLQNLSRQTSGMISNFIAHLQSSDYPGAKSARPQRLTREEQAHRLEQLRQTQQANIRRQKEYYQPKPEKTNKPDED